MSVEPPIKFSPAEPKHEAFYQGLVALAQLNGLRDEEIAALTGKMLGYNRAYNPDASSVPHLVDVFRKNMRRGYEQIKSGEVQPK